MALDSPAGEAQKALSQSEVEALLSQVAPDASGSAAAESPATGAAAPKRYDFRGPSFLTAAELRKLGLRHDEFARSLVTRLSIYLRLEFAAQMSGLESQSFRRLAETFANPTHLVLFKIETLNGIGVLEISSAFGLAMVDRLLGGPGKPPNLQRELTDIEVEVLDLALLPLLKEWCQEVAQAPEARPQVLGHETNPRFLQFTGNDTPMLAIALEVHMNEVQGAIKLGLPNSMLEPILRKLSSALEVKAPELPLVPAIRPKWLPRLNEVVVPLSAQLTDLEIPARELARLQVGDVLQVDPQRINQVKICVAKVPKYVGRLGTREHAWAIELTGVIKS